jgi:hypothetical protein
MAYLQVEDVLKSAEQLHQFVREFAKRRRSQARDDFVEGMFQEVTGHEERLRQYLEEFKERADNGVRATWLQFPGVESLEKAMNELAAADGDDDEIILENVIAANEALRDMYDQSMNQTSVPALSELFERLKELQDHHLRNMAKSVSEFEQQ